jgi:hypothetical protein
MNSKPQILAKFEGLRKPRHRFGPEVFCISAAFIKTPKARIRPIFTKLRFETAVLWHRGSGLHHVQGIDINDVLDVFRRIQIGRTACQ